MINRVLIFLYGIVCYLVFLFSIVYAIGFLGNFGVPKSMDSGPAGSWQSALLVDLALLVLFALQHSVMARPAFKRVFTRMVPAVVERSTYVLASSAALLLLFWQWRPLGGVVWNVQNEAARTVLFSVFVFGWLLVTYVSSLINPFELLGLSQVWLHFRGRPQRRLRFVTPSLYRAVRHPLYIGWFLAFWSTPTMTVTHLVFALGTTIYILVAIPLEERDLMEMHPEYAQYRTQVPMLLPRLRRQTK